MGDKTHWYDSDGNPCHGATLREARKYGYVPSVTEICNIIARPGLEAWKSRQVLMAALTLTRGTDETDDAFADRVLDDAKVHGAAAAELGTEIHTLIARYIEGKEIQPDGRAREIFPHVGEWIAENIDSGVCEQSFCRSDYGGTIDFRGTLSTGESCIIDWKTREIKRVKKDGGMYASDLYDTLPMQLEAYCDTYDRPDVVGNLFINTLSTGPRVVFHRWDIDSLKRGWEMFEHAKELWYLINKF